MKSNWKLIFGILIGALLFGSIGGYAASMLSSKDIAFKSKNENFKSANVGDALDTLYNSVDVTKVLPIGSVISYMGSVAPENYLLCDGSTYNIADYQKLADHIKNSFGSYNFFGGDGTTTFKVPDLRGEFLRGAGTNSHANQGSGSSVGVHQDATEIPKIDIYEGALTIKAPDTKTNGPRNIDYSIGGKQYQTWTTQTWYSTAGDDLSYASRPTNTSVNFIIKAK